MLKKIFQLSNFFLSSIHRNKFWVLIAGCLFATFPFSFVVITVDSKLQAMFLLRRWILYIYVPILTLLLPLITSMMIFLDLESMQILQDFLVLPVNKKKLFTVGFMVHTCLNLLLGMFIGWLLYVLTNFATVLMFSTLYVPVGIILPIALVLLFFSIIYGGLNLFLAYMLDLQRSEAYFLVFFLLTFFWDLIFWGIGGSYARISYSYYKLSLFQFFLTNSLLKLQVIAIIPIKVHILYDMIVLFGLCLLLYYFAMRLFEKKEYESE